MNYFHMVIIYADYFNETFVSYENFQFINKKIKIFFLNNFFTFCLRLILSQIGMGNKRKSYFHKPSQAEKKAKLKFGNNTKLSTNMKGQNKFSSKL